MDREEEEPIGEIIKRARVAHGYSQSELAAELARCSGNRSVSRDYVKRWESGKRIPHGSWRGWLSNALDVPSERLDAGARASQRARRAGMIPRQRGPRRNGQGE